MTRESVGDEALVLSAQGGDELAETELVRRYRGFVRLKASSYFLLGGESDDLIQEGLLGLYKAIRDYRTDRESSFRNFAELCITRQIITAVKTATRNKHTPLNQYVSFSQTPAAAGPDSNVTLAEILPGSKADDPASRAAASEELATFIHAFDDLSPLERGATLLLADGLSYEEAAASLGVPVKKIDNAVQRTRRKISARLADEPPADREPTLRERVPEFLRANPDKTVYEIAVALGASHHYVYDVIRSVEVSSLLVGRRDGRRLRYRIRGAKVPPAPKLSRRQKGKVRDYERANSILTFVARSGRRGATVKEIRQHLGISSNRDWDRVRGLVEPAVRVTGRGRATRWWPVADAGLAA